LRSNGIFKTQKHRYQDELTLTLPNVKEGSVIEFSYIIYSPYVRYIDYYDLQDEIPINKVNMQIVIPEYFEYNLHQRGWLNIPVTSTKTDRKIYFKVRNNLQNDSGFTEKRFTEREVDFIENNYLIEMYLPWKRSPMPLILAIINLRYRLNWLMQSFQGPPVKIMS
jgi:hypothetical protein